MCVSSKSVASQQWSDSLRTIVDAVRLKSQVADKLSRNYVSVKTSSTKNCFLCTRAQLIVTCKPSLPRQSTMLLPSKLLKRLNLRCATLTTSLTRLKTRRTGLRC